jgi:hypothetical protein
MFGEWTEEKYIQVFVGKRPLRTPGHRCEDNIKIDLNETGWEGEDWIHLAHDREH